MIKISRNIELVVSIFSLFLATTASFLVRYNQVEQELILHIWKATSLVIISLGFRLPLELIIIKYEISYLRIFSPILFWILSLIIPTYILVFITVIGVILFLNRNKIYLSITNLLKYLTLSLLYFIIIGSEAWNMHRHPLPDHYLITQSGTGSDSTFYAAITSMIKTHNICSTGIDGITSFQYHYGTYYFLSNISSLLGLNSLYVNHIIAPIIFLPLALYFMIVFLQFCKREITSFLGTSYQPLSYGDHLIFIAVLATLTNAPFGLPFVSNLSFFTSPFQIDSQLLGNIFLGIILILITYPKSDQKYAKYLSFLLIIIFHTLVYFTKSPASHLSLFAIIYVLIRFFHKRTREQNILWILTSFLCLLITLFMSGAIEQSVLNKSGILTLSFFTLWKNQVPIREWQWIFLSNGFYTFSSICILSYMCKKHSSYKTLAKFTDSKFIFLELVTVLTLISIFLTAVFGGALSFASTYYLDSIKFITLLFFAASLCVIFTRVDFKNKNFIVFLKSNSAIKLISCLCIAFLIVTGSGLSLKGWERTLNKYSDSNLSKLNDVNSTTSKVKILQTLSSLSKHHKDKSYTCLWIPKSNTLFWNELAEEKNEGFLPFWPIALSEMSLIDGYPLSNKLNGHFGYRVYGNDDTHGREKNLAEIKTKSAKLGFKKPNRIMGSFELRNILIVKLIKSPFFWICCLYVLTAKGHLEIIDTEYSLRTAKAILENGTMLIEPVCDETRKISPIIDGTDKIYSQYGIGLVAIFIPIVVISKFFSVLFGIDELMLSHFLLSFYNIPFALLGLWFFRNILKSQGQDERLATFLMICLGLGTIFWKYVVTDFSEITQIALLLGAIRSYTLTNDPFRWLKVFSLLSLLILLKILYVIILPPFIILALKDGLKNKKIILNTMHGLFCLIPAAAFLMYLNWLRFDSILQSGYGEHQTAFSFSYLERDWFDYIFSFDRGIIPYSPLLLMIPFLVKDFYFKNKSLLFLVFSISIILYLTTASWIGWKGGYCWGNRNLVTIVPLLTIAFAFIEWEKPLVRKMMALLLLISIPIQIIGVSLKTHEWSTIVTKLTLITDLTKIPNELSGSALLFKEKLNNSSGLYNSEDFVHIRENVIYLTSYESFKGYNFWLVHASKLFTTHYIHFISLLMLIVVVFLCLNIFKRFYVSHEKFFLKYK